MTKKQIFLAHATEDKIRVRELRRLLLERDFSPWLDEEDLTPGKNWRVEIPKAIENSTVCLVCLSKQSVGKKGYVQREFRYALSAYADRPSGTVYLIPVRLDDCEVPDIYLPKLELNLRDIQWVDWFDDHGFEKLVRAIEDGPIVDGPPPSNVESFKDIDEEWCPEMIMLPAGNFIMSSPKTENGQDGPQHLVLISQPFALGRYPITFNEYDYFCTETGRDSPADSRLEISKRGRRPVTNVDHADAEAYCAWLSDRTGFIYQLPTEAMWEYACRAGTTTAYAFGDDLTTEQAHFDQGGGSGQTADVGSYPANAWGLHDMHGNIWEWCADAMREYRANETLADPVGVGFERMIRGGCFFDPKFDLRSARRYLYRPDYRSFSIGFRCARVKRSLRPPEPEPGFFQRLFG